MWKVRHEGSPTALSDLTLAQVAEGLADGRWEPTDEVMGPNEKTWVPIESHPQLADIAAELEPPPPRHYDDETRLDMNALIDVCLVLLIFFILTTSYAVIQKQLEAPGVSADKVGPPVITKEKVEQQMVSVTVRMENGKPVIKVEDRVVEPNNLQSELRQRVKASGKTQLFLDIDDDVPHSVMVAVQDAAKGAGMEKISLVDPDKSKP
ncbi:MAG TPA: biopolymer transporter ExbD [Gemmataceae bacterium]|nr:biopolymer transporter ExbD [Gemmataceae bacterium]